MDLIPEATIRVSRLDLQGAIDLGLRLNSLPRAGLYLFDFSQLEWVEPFGMLYFARQLRAFADARKPARCRAVNHQHLTYAAHMGFFQSFGLNHGNEPGEAPGNKRYIPITELRLSDLRREAIDRIEDPRAIIEGKCEQLASVLAAGVPGEVHDTLSYSLREIFRNVLEHSEADSIWYAAQAWPSKQMVELAILDQGIGLRKSLARNPHISMTSDEDALRLALLPGISGVAYKGGPRQRRDAWANSGYGLFMTSRLCEKGGSFTICSGERGLRFDSNGEQSFEVGFQGTALKLELYIPEIRELAASLSALRDLGYEIAGELKGTANLTASMSSRMLARDFSK